MLRLLFLALAGTLLWTGCRTPEKAPVETAAAGTYTQTTPSRDGIGKVYMGREIAQYMSHRGAGWLERDDREREEQPDRVVASLGLNPSDTVVDLGAGTGYFTRRLARAVPEGRVFAVDIQQEMLDLLVAQLREEQIENVEPILGTASDPNLPDAAVDLTLMVDAYHEFEYPAEIMAALYRATVPGGRVVLVEYRGEDPSVPIKPLHKMTEAQVIRELEASGFRHVETLGFLAQQHVLVFERPA
jgi:ubiquinone/menaquinone biosynthesis C-methylase UbiE